MKLFKSLVFGNSSFFHFCEIMKFLFEFIFIRTHKTPWLSGRWKFTTTSQCLTNSPKLQYQIGRALSRFVGLKTPCLQCLVGFSNRPYRKVIKFEKNSNLWAVLGDPNFDTKHAIYAKNVTVSESSVSE